MTINICGASWADKSWNCAWDLNELFLDKWGEPPTIHPAHVELIAKPIKHRNSIQLFF